jgi:6-phosphogluconolactonase/glucosamine-6-phosphate isomerase/deaminase
MAEELEWWDFDSAEEFVDQVVGDVSFIIESALDARGQALVAFPGGSTPVPILQKLTGWSRSAIRFQMLPCWRRFFCRKAHGCSR